MPPLLGLGLRHRLTHGLEQPSGKPAPAPPRILFLILAWLLLLLFWCARLHLGGVGGSCRGLWGRRERGFGENRGGESLQEERSVCKRERERERNGCIRYEMKMGLAERVELRRKIFKGGWRRWEQDIQTDKSEEAETLSLREGVESERGRCPEL